jgi:cyclopropane-fatty-acyl-phospholipid synthase
MQITERQFQQPASGKSAPIKTYVPSEPGRGITYEVIYRDGSSVVRGSGHPAFSFLLKDVRQLDWLLRSDLYSAALAFIRGDFDIHGDIVSAIRFKARTTHRGLRDLFASMAARLASRRIESWFQTSMRAAQNVRFHYDRSNEFYRSFLDSRMVYSCAYFKDSNYSLDEAQLAKLDHICRKLDLRPEERFLDIGCGWGALVLRAVEKYGAVATGCTLSVRQDLYAERLIAERKLERRVTVHESDYRKLTGQFDKIASVGMFEHVGRHRLREYFQRVFTLLEDDGLFLNHGIIRPEGTKDGPETLFLQRKVFPGGELATLSTVIREAEDAGFEVLDVENLRPHYALTCGHWVERLQQNAVECLKHVDHETYRTWLLYLAGSALSFELASTDLSQILMAKRGPFQMRRLTREYMYTYGDMPVKSQ